MSKSDLPNLDPNIKSSRNPIVAALLSLILFGGTGQIYLGQIKKGVLLIALMLLLLLLLQDVGFLIPIVGALDAYILAKKLRKGQLIGEWTFFSRADLIELQNELVPNKSTVTVIGLVAGVICAALGFVPFGLLHEFLGGLVNDMPGDTSNLFILAYGFPLPMIAAIVVLPLGGAIMGMIGANIGIKRHLKKNIGNDNMWRRITFRWGLIFGFLINLFFGFFSQ